LRLRLWVCAVGNRVGDPILITGRNRGNEGAWDSSSWRSQFLTVIQKDSIGNISRAKGVMIVKNQ
jgi:hypothetical protein